MKFHNELSTKVWENDDLKPEVKKKLNEIADAFIEFLEVDRDAIKDVVITGSMASYNYTQYSDVDLHLKVDYDKIHEDCPIVQGYLWQSKAMFNKNHDISIYGVPVEVYAESIDEDTVHNGLYSLWQEKWIDFPQKIKPTDNDSAVEAKFNEFKDAAENLNDSEEAEELINKLYEMRKAGLEEVGEFSTENLAFKKVRDAGILDKLKQMKKEKIDKQLSLESYNESKSEMKLIFELTDKKDKSFEEEIDIYKDEDGDFTCNVPKHTKLGKDQTLVGNTIQVLKDVIKKEFEKEGYKVKYKNIEYPIKNESIKENKTESKGIYKPSLILKAYKAQQKWLEGQEVGENEQAPQIQLFIIENDEIVGYNYINRKDVYTYQPEENEYYLDRTRDTGDVITDYNLEPAQKLVDTWNSFKTTKLKESLDILIQEALGE